MFVFQVSNADFDDDEDRDLSTTRAKSALETLQMGVAREGVSERVVGHCPPSLREPWFIRGLIAGNGVISICRLFTYV